MTLSSRASSGDSRRAHMTKGVRIAEGRTAEIFAWNEGKVVKLFRERMGIVYERISGPSMLREFSSRPWRLPRFARLLAELHASMHVREAPDLPSQRRRLQREIDSATLPQMAKNAALAALASLADGNVLCHGDFHPDNILMSHTGPIIIDWPVATRGNPLADVARTLLLLRLGEPRRVRHRAGCSGWVGYRSLECIWHGTRRCAASRSATSMPSGYQLLRRASEEIAEERPRLDAHIDGLLRETA